MMGKRHGSLRHAGQPACLAGTMSHAIRCYPGSKAVGVGMEGDSRRVASVGQADVMPSQGGARQPRRRSGNLRGNLRREAASGWGRMSGRRNQLWDVGTSISAVKARWDRVIMKAGVGRQTRPLLVALLPISGARARLPQWGAVITNGAKGQERLRIQWNVVMTNGARAREHPTRWDAVMTNGARARERPRIQWGAAMTNGARARRCVGAARTNGAGSPRRMGIVQARWKIRALIRAAGRAEGQNLRASQRGNGGDRDSGARLTLDGAIMNRLTSGGKLLRRSLLKQPDQHRKAQAAPAVRVVCQLWDRPRVLATNGARQDLLARRRAALSRAAVGANETSPPGRLNPDETSLPGRCLAGSRLNLSRQPRGAARAINLPRRPNGNRQVEALRSLPPGKGQAQRMIGGNRLPRLNQI
jgi:hypothetical protein